MIVSAYIEVSTTYLSHLIFDISHTNTDIVMSTPFPLPASACRVAGFRDCRCIVLLLTAVIKLSSGVLPRSI